ncbi:hypothetical protein [Candidatus Uabimicrobium sp. HlEnr_7]|uniref:hypothetical protein n=1 Tax=Candidatus Uabimicrobium helgolandensis TaxID=3095367 RepID=UPI00355806E9
MLISVVSGFIALASVGFIVMSGIFAAGGMANNKGCSTTKANAVFYGSILFAIAIFSLHVYGQNTYNSLKEGQSNTISLIFLFAGIPINIIWLAIVFVIWPKN